MAAARRSRRQTKACNKPLLMSSQNFNFQVTGQVKVRSNTKSWTFSSMGFETLRWASLVIKTVNIVQNPSLERNRNARFKKGSVKHISGSRSSHEGKVTMSHNATLYSRHVTRVWEYFSAYNSIMTLILLYEQQFGKKCEN